VQDSIRKLFRNRSGALIAGIIAAVIAVVLLVVYLKSYRSSVNSGKRTERVLVATKMIPTGTSGDLIAKQNLYLVTTVQQDQLKLNAITDPSALNDRVAAANIFPGQQLTQDDFTTESPQSIPYEITGTQRAIAVPVDANHGLIGQVAAGNYVDVYVGVNAGTTDAASGGSAHSGQLVTLLAPNVYVLVAPGGSSGSGAVLRVATKDVAKFAYAADNATIWLVLRPQVGSSVTPPATATLSSLLAGVK
jgi:Flp pilus assembly protein CpaB